MISRFHIFRVAISDCPRLHLECRNFHEHYLVLVRKLCVREMSNVGACSADDGGVVVTRGAHYTANTIGVFSTRINPGPSVHWIFFILVASRIWDSFSYDYDSMMRWFNFWIKINNQWSGRTYCKNWGNIASSDSFTVWNGFIWSKNNVYQPIVDFLWKSLKSHHCSIAERMNDRNGKTRV